MTIEFDRDSPAVEQGSGNYYMDEAAKTGVWPQPEEYMPHSGQEVSAQVSDHVVPEQYAPLSVEEIEQRTAVIAGSGHKAAAAIAEHAAQKRLMKRTQGDTSLIRALERAHRERRNAQDLATD